MSRPTIPVFKPASTGHSLTPIIWPEGPPSMPPAAASLPNQTTPPVTRIPTGRRAKRPPRPDDGEPVDYAFRDLAPAERGPQITREGRPKLSLDDDRLAHRQWFILRTAPREEMRAVLILERMGHAVLYPRHAVFRRRNRYSKSKMGVLRPLMVRYLFVGFANDPNWLEALSCSSVTGVVALNGKPRELAFGSIRGFMRGNKCYDAPDHHRFMQTHREFEEGQTVEVLDGPFSGHAVVVESITGKQAKALITIFGQTQTVDMPVDNLVAMQR